ncbi:MAG: ABC transporter permease, partial [Alphaproteobacteria bacterium]
MGSFAIAAIACLLAAAALAYGFRALLGMVLPAETARAIRGAPLTAAFGLLVILVYAVAAVFAPLIAPFGEAEVVAGAYAPADGTLLLGADQIGRDMLSRIIFGARNT